MAWIRGAICAENNVESIKEKTLKLFDAVVLKNGLNLCDIEAILFTVTKDIDACYPAKFVREGHVELSNVAFMCTQEMDVVGSLQKCIRICVVTNFKFSQKDACHCYLDEAECLRPDLR